MVREATYDVAIVDLRLRGLSGDVFIVEAAQICKNLKYVIHTGSVNYALSDELVKIGVKPEHIFRKPLEDLNVIVDAINQGAADYVVKPFRPAELLARIKRLLIDP